MFLFAINLQCLWHCQHFPLFYQLSGLVLQQMKKCFNHNHVTMVLVIVIFVYVLWITVNYSGKR